MSAGFRLALFRRIEEVQEIVGTLPRNPLFFEKSIHPLSD
jgi:hypothetical protein